MKKDFEAHYRQPKMKRGEGRTIPKFYMRCESEHNEIFLYELQLAEKN